MISGENIQQYINFLHEKKYATPANEELLGRWKSLNDFEIIQQLQGLYNFWGIDSMTAAMYERLFIQQSQQPILPATAQDPAPVLSDYMDDTKKKTGTGFRYFGIGLIAVIIIGIAAWLWTRTGTLSGTNTDLQKRMQQAKDSVSQERAIRLQQEQALQRAAFEKAQKIKAVKDNISKFVTQKVTYDYDGFFGGIDNVSITVSNNSDFKINEVTVLLQYIKKNGDLYETQNVTISNIKPHAQKKVNGPDSKRGTQMDSKLGRVVLDEHAEQ